MSSILSIIRLILWGLTVNAGRLPRLVGGVLRLALRPLGWLCWKLFRRNGKRRVFIALLLFLVALPALQFGAAGIIGNWNAGKAERQAQQWDRDQQLIPAPLPR